MMRGEVAAVADVERGGRDPVRVAAIGDLHIRTRTPPALRAAFRALHGAADVLVVAGDITDGGRQPEAEHAAELFRQASVPVVAVLGNHDLRCLRRAAFRRTLEGSGAIVLDGESVVLTASGGTRVGFAGVGGCGGGFWPIEGPDAIQNRAFKALALRTRREAAGLDRALGEVDADVTIAVTHFAPTATTLGREPIAKYWMLGNCELGRVIDRHAVDLVLHGHAHLGNPIGITAGGTPVRNVAQAVTGGLVVHEVRRRSGTEPSVPTSLAGART
ncbi:MAG: metallophosphoesterase [Chloroflexota bacterium]|nr:metallophosphoesterase [Chloroflexota bacterium]